MKHNGNQVEAGTLGTDYARWNWVCNHNDAACDDPANTDWDAVYRDFAETIATELETPNTLDPNGFENPALAHDGFENAAERAAFIDAFVAEKHHIRDGQE